MKPTASIEASIPGSSGAFIPIYALSSNVRSREIFGSVNKSRGEGGFNSSRVKESMVNTEAISSSSTCSTRAQFCVLVGVTVAALIFAPGSLKGVEGVDPVDWSLLR